VALAGLGPAGWCAYALGMHQFLVLCHLCHFQDFSVEIDQNVPSKVLSGFFFAYAEAGNLLP
jgi:hypothetical protein